MGCVSFFCICISFDSIGKRVNPVHEHDKWVEQLDLDAYGRDVKELGKKLRAGEGQEDVDHLEKIMLWSNM